MKGIFYFVLKLDNFLPQVDFYPRACFFGVSQMAFFTLNPADGGGEIHRQQISLIVFVKLYGITDIFFVTNLFKVIIVSNWFMGVIFVIRILLLFAVFCLWLDFGHA